MIAFSSEVQCGIENLWQSGCSNGRRDHENFGGLVGRNYFKAFISDFHCSFGDKSGRMLIK